MWIIQVGSEVPGYWSQLAARSLAIGTGSVKDCEDMKIAMITMLDNDVHCSDISHQNENTGNHNLINNRYRLRGLKSKKPGLSQTYLKDNIFSLQYIPT